MPRQSVYDMPFTRVYEAFDVYKVMVKSNKGKQVIGYTYPVQSLEGDICYVYSCNLFDQRPLLWT